MNRFCITLLSLSTIAALTLSGCSSWDEGAQSVPTESSSTESSPAAASTTSSEAKASLPDAREITGVNSVSEISEVEPVANNPSPALPVDYTDAQGNQVTVTDVSRIVALDIYGTFTQTLRGLGLQENIVGRSVSSSQPSFEEVPVVTEQGHNINVEAVLNLEPTLVIADPSIRPAEAFEQIKAAGVPVIMLEPERSLEGIDDDIMEIATIVGLPKEGKQLADRSAQQAKEAVDKARSMAPNDPLKIAFLYARGNGDAFFVMGSDFSTDDLIGALGGVDLASEKDITARIPATAEALADLNPEVFLMMNGGFASNGDLEGLLARPGVSQTTAGQKPRVLTLPDGPSLAFGPNTGELIEKAALALYQGENQ